MLLAVRYLLDRLAGPRSRADQLLALRRRLLAEPGPGRASPAEERLALRLRELREQLAARLGQVQACARCGLRYANPKLKVWPGGECCSAETMGLFSEQELAALRLAATTPGDLRPPRGDHRGCAFRGPSGCALTVAHRPTVCVGYACRELLAELRRRGDGPTIARLQDELQRVFQRFVAARAARLERTLFDELKAGLLEASSRPAPARGVPRTRRGQARGAWAPEGTPPTGSP